MVTYTDYINVPAREIEIYATVGSNEKFVPRQALQWFLDKHTKAGTMLDKHGINKLPIKQYPTYFQLSDVVEKLGVDIDTVSRFTAKKKAGKAIIPMLPTFRIVFFVNGDEYKSNLKSLISLEDFTDFIVNKCEIEIVVRHLIFNLDWNHKKHKNKNEKDLVDHYILDTLERWIKINEDRGRDWDPQEHVYHRLERIVKTGIEKDYYVQCFLTNRHQWKSEKQVAPKLHEFRVDYESKDARPYSEMTLKRLFRIAPVIHIKFPTSTTMHRTRVIIGEDLSTVNLYEMIKLQAINFIFPLPKNVKIKPEDENISYDEFIEKYEQKRWFPVSEEGVAEVGYGNKDATALVKNKNRWLRFAIIKFDETVRHRLGFEVEAEYDPLSPDNN
jgi:hypothetical protein